MAGKIPVYIGSYSNAAGEGIYPFVFDSATGELSPLCAPVKLENPSYLAFSRDFRFLYAAMEIPSADERTGGRVAAFSVDVSGRLHALNEQPTKGSDPCYLRADSRNSTLVCANYSSGTMTVFPLAADGGILPCAAVVKHAGAGPVKGRQDGPHMHFTDFALDERFVCTADLGIDEIRFYRFNGETGSVSGREQAAVALKPGSGPRHMAFHPHRRFAYVVSELSSEVAAIAYSEDDRFEIRQYISTLPRGCAVPSTAAAIRISADGSTLFASNRGDDSIAVFDIKKDGLLDWIGSYPSGGEGPRDFMLDKGNRYMLVANEKSGAVSVLEMDRGTRALRATGRSAAVYRPFCIAFKD